MNKFEEKERFIQCMKDSYPPGTRLILISMNVYYAPIPSGMRGTVDHVDDAVQIHMHWDNGRTLASVPEEDDFHRLTEEELAEENEDMDEDNAPVMGM